MTAARFYPIAPLLALLLASCVPAGHKLTRDEAFMKPDAARNAWRKVAVLPFTGDPVFRRVAGEWFAFRLHKRGLFEVVDPVLAGIELDKNGVRLDEAATTADEARRAGRLLGVDGVVFGSIAQRPPIAQGWPTAAATVVDMATGKVVADSVQSYPGWSRHREETVMAAVDRVSEDLAPVFYAAAGKTWTPPPNVETPWAAPETREPALQ